MLGVVNGYRKTLPALTVHPASETKYGTWTNRRIIKMVIEVKNLKPDHEKWLKDQDIEEAFVFEKLDKIHTNIICADIDLDTLTDMLDVISVEWRLV